MPYAFMEGEVQRRRRCNGSGNVTVLPDYFSHPRFLKYQNGVIALATISTSANG